MSRWQVRWGEADQRAVAALAELEQVLDDLARGKERVMAEVVSPSGSSLAIALGGGGDDTFLNYIPANKNPPYASTVGDEHAEGTLEFQFAGEWSEIPRRHLIPLSSGRAAMAHFFETGELSPAVRWEED